MKEIDGQFNGSIEHCIVIAYDNGYLATSENAAKELAQLRNRIADAKEAQAKHIDANINLAKMNADVLIINNSDGTKTWVEHPFDALKTCPEHGKICGNCFHYKRCYALFSCWKEQTCCDWEPSRFKEK
jgi:hypothetical protein